MRKREIQDGGDHNGAQAPDYDALDEPFAALIGDSVSVQVAGHGFYLSRYRVGLVIRRGGVGGDIERVFVGHQGGGIENRVQTLLVHELLDDLGHASAQALNGLVALLLDIGVEILLQAFHLALFALGLRLQVHLLLRRSACPGCSAAWSEDR